MPPPHPPSVSKFIIAMPLWAVMERFRTLGPPPKSWWDYVQKHGMVETAENPPFWAEIKKGVVKLSFRLGDSKMGPGRITRGLRIDYSFSGELYDVSQGTELVLRARQYRQMLFFRLQVQLVPILIWIWYFYSNIVGGEIQNARSIVGMGIAIIVFVYLFGSAAYGYEAFFARRHKQCIELIEQLFADELVESNHHTDDPT